EAISIEQAAAGHNEPIIAANLHNLATVYQELGRYPEAESTYRQSVDMTERAGGASSPEIIPTLLHLGALDYQLGRFQPARVNLARALAIAEKNQLTRETCAILQQLSEISFVQQNLVVDERLIHRALR